MYAIIATGGKQYKVTEGAIISIEKLGVSTGEEITFDQVIMVSKDDNLTIGKPIVKDATVTAIALGDGKGKKIVIYKYKAKKGYHKKQGHRQPFTKIRIEKINA